MVLSSEFPEIGNRQDYRRGVFGSYCARPPSRPGQTRASATPAARIDLLQGADQTLYLRTWREAKVELPGTLTVNEPKMLFEATPDVISLSLAMRDDSAFCHSCGKSLATPATSASTSPAPPTAQPKRGNLRAILTGMTVVAVLVSLMAILWLRSSRHDPDSSAQEGAGQVALKTKEKPSFDCSKARTATDNAICADEDLTTLEVSNGGCLSADWIDHHGNNSQHLEWYKGYQESCNAAAQAEVAYIEGVHFEGFVSTIREALQASNVNTLPTIVGQCTTTTVSMSRPGLPKESNGPAFQAVAARISHADGGSQVFLPTRSRVLCNRASETRFFSVSVSIRVLPTRGRTW